MRVVAFVFALLLFSSQVSAELQLFHVVEIQAGRNATVMASVSSDETGALAVRTALDCCNVEAPTTADVMQGTETMLFVKIHVPLNQTHGYHSLAVSAGNATKTITISVKESDLVARIPGLTRYADSLRATAREKASDGTSVDEVMVMLDAVSDRLAKARMAVDNDDENALYSALLAAERKLYYEAPLALNATSWTASLQGLIWIPALLIAVAAGLILLRIRGI